MTYYVGVGTGGADLGSTAPKNAGTYTVVASFPGSTSYTSADSMTSFTIATAPLTITASNETKVYGSTFILSSTEFSQSGLIAGDTVSSVTLTSAGTTSTAQVANSPYSIVPSEAMGTGLANYTINYVNGQLTVTPAPLTVSGVTAGNKVYDGTTTTALSTGSAALVGVVNGDSVTLNTGGATGTFASKNVGTGITVTIAGLTISGPQAGDYTLIQPTTTANITKAALTITAVTNTKTYDGTTSAAAIPTVSGLQIGDTVTNLTETYDTPAVGTGKTLSVATYTVNDGNGGNNYTVSTVANHTGVITAASAVFLPPPNTTTQGNWNGVYGSQGYEVIGGTSSLPPYASVTPASDSSWTWAASTTDPRALQNASPSTGRVAATWYSSTSFTVDVNLTDNQPHNLTLYFVDWDSTARDETVQLSDAVSHAVLDTETVSSFHNGVYLQWKVSGNILITITRLGVANAVLSGLFFDADPPGSSAFASTSRSGPSVESQSIGIGSSSNVATIEMGTVDSSNDSDTYDLLPTANASFSARKPVHDAALEQVSAIHRWTRARFES